MSGIEQIARNAAKMPLILVLILVAQFVGTSSTARSQDVAQETQTKAARLLRLRLPITGNDDTTFRTSLDRTRKQLLAENTSDDKPVIVIEFVPLAGGDGFGQGTDYSRAYTLAKHLTDGSMAGVRTIAFVPQTIKGHGVLVALACDDLAISQTAEIGEAGIDEDKSLPISPGIVEEYRKVAKMRPTPEAIAVGLVDHSLEVVKADTEANVSEYVLREDLEKLEEEMTIVKTTTLFPAGTSGLLTGREARDYTVARYFADSRKNLAEALNLPESSLAEDAALVADWRPVMYSQEGPITFRAKRRAADLIDNEIIQTNANWIGLRMNSAGGSPEASLDFANYLTKIGTEERRTVAYVPEQALGAASIVALAANQLVVHPGTILGGADGEPLDADQLDAISETIRTSIADGTPRTWSLLQAMVDPDIEVFRYTNTQTAAERLFSEQEAEAQEDRDDWRQGAQITTPGEVLELNTDELVEYGIAAHVVDNVEELKQLYGFENDPLEVRITWSQELAEMLASPGVAVLLLVIAFCGVYFELHTPGLGIGGFVAALALLLFFWSKADGSVGWLEVLLFVGGLMAIMLEMFVLPGVGIFGIGGALMVISSLVLAGQRNLIPRTTEDYQELQSSLAVVATACGLMIVAALLLRRYLPQIPILNAMLLHGPQGHELEDLSYRESLAEYSHLIGHRGLTTTPLMPSGRAEFDGELVDVIAIGDAVEQGETVEVTSARGSRVEVRRVT